MVCVGRKTILSEPGHTNIQRSMKKAETARTPEKRDHSRGEKRRESSYMT